MVGWGLGVIIDIHPPSSASGSQYKLRFADASYTDELKKFFPLSTNFESERWFFFSFFWETTFSPLKEKLFKHSLRPPWKVEVRWFSFCVCGFGFVRVLFWREIHPPSFFFLDEQWEPMDFIVWVFFFVSRTQKTPEERGELNVFFNNDRVCFFRVRSNRPARALEASY